MPIAVQSPGGEAGNQFDRQAAGIKGVSPAAAERRAHRRCAFIGGIIGNSQPILAETITPTLPTQQFMNTHGPQWDITPKVIQDTLNEQAERRTHMGRHNTLRTADQLLADVEASPGGHIVDVRGDPNPGLYIVNSMPDRGLDRERFHNGLDNPITVQAYHDSLGASMERIGAIPGASPEQVNSLKVARLLRTAATLTVIRALYPDVVPVGVSRQNGGVDIKVLE